MEYRKFEATRLRQLCKDRNLSEKGVKEVLIKRLIDSDLKKENANQLELGGDTYKTIRRDVRAEKRAGNQLFIHPKTSNISHYLNAGIIYPLVLEESQIYISDNRKRDLFTLFPDNIILSPEPINSFEEEDALLDIITDKLELIPIPDSELYRCEVPIPISRIRSMMFSSHTAKSTFISSSKTFPDFFVEEKICFVSSNRNPIIVNLGELKMTPNGGVDKWHDILDRYDKLLGMFGFMKNSGIFYADRTSHFEEYPQNYLAALSVINSGVNIKPTKDIALYKYIIFPSNIELTTIQRLLFQQILKAIYQNVEMDLDFAITTLLSAANSQLASSDEQKELREIIEQFEKLKAKQISYKDIAYHDLISRNYPVMALLFLARFPNKSRQHTDKQAVRNNFMENNSPMSKSVSEFLLGVLGLYYGYKTMIKEDTNLNLNDPFFASLSQKYQSIKFKSTSYIDRLVIESAYWFAIEGGISNSLFPYLDFQRAEFRESSSVRVGTYEYQNNSYAFLGSTVAMYRRINKIDMIYEAVEKNYSNSIPVDSMLLHHLLSKYGITRGQLFELIRNNASSIDLDEIHQLIDFDKKLKSRK